MVQIAIELRDMTQQALDDESSDEDEEEADVETVSRRQKLGSWLEYSRKRVDKIEKLWKRKLEDTDDEFGDQPHSGSDDSGDDTDSHIRK